MARQYHGLKLVEALEHMYDVVGELYKVGAKPESLLRESLKGVNVEKEATILSRAITASYWLRKLTYALKELVVEAQRFAIARRLYAYEEACEIRGVLLWSQTIRRMATLQPPLQLVLVKTFNTPEYVLLRHTVATVRSLLEHYSRTLEIEVEKLLEDLKRQLGLRQAIIKGFDKGVRRLLHTMNTCTSLLRKLEKKTILSQVDGVKTPARTTPQQLLNTYKSRRRKLAQLITEKPWKPKWVQKLLQLAKQVEELADELEEVKDVISHTKRSIKLGKARKIASTSLRLLSWRLYELYTLYILLQAITKLAKIEHVKLDEKNHQLHIILSNGEKLVILYNQPLENSILAKAKAHWIANGSIPSETIQKMRGKPDITFKTSNNTKLIILEAKFSNNPTYLSAARFKILAYTYEYQAQAAILAYPTPPTRTSLDPEEAEIAGILGEAYEKDGIKIELKNTTLYILPIVPHESRLRRNTQILQKVLKEFLDKMG